MCIRSVNEPSVLLSISVEEHSGFSSVILVLGERINEVLVARLASAEREREREREKEKERVVIFNDSV